MLKKSIAAGLAAIVSMGLACTLGTATAKADLIVNGGFETGDFTGWTVVTDGHTFVDSGTAANSNGPHAGSYYAALGELSCCGSLSQSFADSSGEVLTLSYWLAIDQGDIPPIDNYFEAFWNGNAITGSLVSNGNSPYLQYTFNLLATGGDSLEFEAYNRPAWSGLDDVSLNPLVTGVPEPASIALFGSALLGLVFARRRRCACAQLQLFLR